MLFVGAVISLAIGSVTIITYKIKNRNHNHQVEREVNGSEGKKGSVHKEVMQVTSI